MKKRYFERSVGAALCLALVFFLVACNESKADPKAEAPPKPVEPDLDANNFKVDHPEQFPLVTAVEHKAAPALNVTGVVQPDIARAVPVISLAAGRVVEIKARLGDAVKKGQVLLRVQSNDVSGAYQTYVKAVNDERLARQQLERAQILYEKGAIAKSALEPPKTPNRMPKPIWMPQPNSYGFSASTRSIPPASSTSSRPYRA